jgi:hypothetical protein
MTSEALTLSEAAHRLRITYWACRDRVLRGDVKGWSDPVTRRWLVDAADVERICEETQRSQGDSD